MSRARAALFVLLAVVSCQGLPIAPICGEIPSGGCPEDRGGTCEDPTCTGLYECTADNTWTEMQRCPAHDGGGGSGGSSSTGGGDRLDGGSDGSDSDGCTQVSIDLSGQTVDCMPDLENPPDCPVQAALGCIETACLVGCTDFWLCKTCPDGADWVPVAYCTDEGVLITQKPECD
jgi:hypothetical protein